MLIELITYYSFIEYSICKLHTSYNRVSIYLNNLNMKATRNHKPSLLLNESDTLRVIYTLQLHSYKPSIELIWTFIFKEISKRSGMMLCLD